MAEQQITLTLPDRKLQILQLTAAAIDKTVDELISRWVDESIVVNINVNIREVKGRV